MASKSPKLPKIKLLKCHECEETGCEASFASKYKLIVHLRTHRGERPYVCDQPDCGKSYTNPSHLKRHKKVGHNPNPAEQILCEHPGCGTVFANKYSLKKHFTRKHNDQREYAFNCGQCSQGFARKKQLQQHSYVHTGEAYFKCDKCSMSFVSIIAYNKHKRQHKTYSCDCGDVFHRWSLFLKHRKECQQPQFTCEICNKNFKQSSNLKQHLLVHSDECERKLFFCSYDDCHRFYSYKKNLDAHVKVFHKKEREVVKLVCTYPGCSVKLTTKASFKQHLSRHMEVKKKKGARKVRKDKGKAKKSMASVMSGLSVPLEVDKHLVNQGASEAVHSAVDKQKENEIVNSTEGSPKNVDKQKESEIVIVDNTEGSPRDVEVAPTTVDGQEVTNIVADLDNMLLSQCDLVLKQLEEKIGDKTQLEVVENLIKCS